MSYESDRAARAERHQAMLQNDKPEWIVLNLFTSIEVHANRAGFEFLGQKFLEMAEAAPGDDSWLPTDSKVVEMGPPVFILRMAGEHPEKPAPPPGPSDEEQLRDSRNKLATRAASALFIPPVVEE